MSALRPIRLVGPALLAVSVVAAAASVPADSLLADTQVGLLAAGSLLITAAAFANPVRARTGWRVLLGAGEVAIGVAVPIGVLGTGIDAGLVHLYLFVAGAAAVALLAVIGSQMLIHRGAAG